MKGTGRTDFYEQLEGEDALDFDKFTIVAVEAPGWGRSRPPVRRYGNTYYEKDADTFQAVMQVSNQLKHILRKNNHLFNNCKAFGFQ